MRRKLIRQGRNTMTLSLPRAWVERNALASGGEVEVFERGSDLVVGPPLSRGSGSIRIHVTGLDRSTILLLVQSLYTYGYDEIIVQTRDEKAHHHVHDESVQLTALMQDAATRLVGIEVVAYAPGEYTLHMLASESRESFEPLLRRLFRLMSDLLRVAIRRYRTGDPAQAEEFMLRHVQVRRFINFALRLLNKFGHPRADQTTYYFAIVTFLRKLEEAVKNTSGPRFNPVKLTPKACDFLERTADCFDLFHALFFDLKLSSVSELTKNRDALKRGLFLSYAKMSAEDAFVLGGFMQVLDLLMDLVELRLAIEAESHQTPAP